MTRIHAITALSAALMIAGCGDSQKQEEAPQPKPAALMAAPAPTANPVEAQPVDDVPLNANATDGSTTERVQQSPARQPLGSHTIGDRREQ